ncbi:MAG: hypothetical protein K0S14_2943 [Thermomicrobiales bacterium]|jgi:hypothetical protein|nr:hypothetical protein [Thermomicrobiales bacterium]
MRARIHVGCDVRNRLVVLTVVSLMAVAAIGIPADGRAIQDTDGEPSGARVRIVHGIANAGPLDIYVDGSIALIGLVFGNASANVVLRGGEHAFTVVPTGETPDLAIADGTIAVDDGALAYVALLGTLDSASVGLFEADDRPLDQGLARFRIISGVPDTGEIVPMFAGGDALSEPLGFGDASQYASIDAGTYDLEFLESESGVLLLTLPQTPFAEGTTTDLILVGQVGDGTLTALVQPIQVELARAVGRAAQILMGSCSDLEAVAADLGIVQIGQGAAVGSAGTDSVAQVFGSASIPFATLVASPHAVVVSEDIDAEGDLIACGDIGGTLTDTGALVIALRTQSAGANVGVAVIAPALEDPGVTGVSVFVIESETAANAAATPVSSVD